MSKITFSSLPSWKNLFKVLSLQHVSDYDILKFWEIRESDVSYFLSRTAWSLYALGKFLEKTNPNEKPAIYIPDYFCDDALHLLSPLNLEIVFYPIKEDLTPDWDKVELISDSKPCNAFVLVHYFGSTNDLEGASKFCRKNNAIFVEDAAHSAFPNKSIGQKGDIICFSAHKHLPIPEGSVLTIRFNSKAFKSFGKKESQLLFDEIIQGLSAINKFPLVWILKKLVQKIITQRTYPPESQLSNIKYQEPLANNASKLILRNYLNTTKNIQKTRLENYYFLDGYIAQNFQNSTSLIEDSPYLAPYVSSDKDIDDLCNKMRKKGIPAQTWPHLPEEIKSENNIYANKLRKKMIFFPIHQTLDLNSLEKLSNKINKYMGFSFDEKRIRISKLKNKEEWDDLFLNIKKSNLTQSWSYGEAKESSESWVPTRYKIMLDHQCIGLVQILIKKIGPLKLVRINKGPLIFSKKTANSFSELSTILRALKSLMPIYKGFIVLIAPYFEINRGFFSLFKSLNFFRRANGESSAWIDLSKSSEELRAKLNGKWRNQLKKSETTLKLHLTDSDNDFEKIMEEYSQMKTNIDFPGVSLNLLRSIWRSSDKPLRILEAKNKEGQTIGAIILYLHGRCATYLIGWNTDEGRILNSTNFLLWNAILILKDLNCYAFDLGGIDLENLKEISHFKRGLGGDEYQLIGEFIGI